MTTGATAEACARTLKRAGAASVELLVFARVVRGSQPWEGEKANRGKANRIDG